MWLWTSRRLRRRIKELREALALSRRYRNQLERIADTRLIRIHYLEDQIRDMTPMRDNHGKFISTKGYP